MFVVLNYCGYKVVFFVLIYFVLCLHNDGKCSEQRAITITIIPLFVQRKIAGLSGASMSYALCPANIVIDCFGIQYERIRIHEKMDFVDIVAYQGSLCVCD